MINRTKKYFALILVIPLSFVSSCATMPGYLMTQLDVDVGRPVLALKQNDTLKMGFGSHINMVDIFPGRIMVSYQSGGEGTTRPLVMPWPLITDDAGLTWRHDNPYPSIQNIDPKKTPAYVDSGGFMPKLWIGFSQGTVNMPPATRLGYSYHANINRSVDGNLWPPIYGIRSIDDGKSWSEPFKVKYNIPDNVLDDLTGRFGVVSPAAYVENDGIYQVAYCPRKSRDKKYDSLLFRSSDGGDTYDFVSVIASIDDANFSKRSHGPAEPALLALSTNEFVCIMRTGDDIGTAGVSVNAAAGNMIMARSYDAGRTWGISNLRIPGVMPRLLKMSNNVIVLGTGRPGNRLYFSLNGGRSWGSRVDLTPAGMVMTSGYLDFREVEPGRLLVVYDVVNAPLDPAFGTEDTTMINKIGKIMGDVILGPSSASQDRYNQIIARYVDVKLKK